MNYDSQSLNYKWFTPTGCIDIGIRKIECVTNAQLLRQSNEMWLRSLSENLSLSSSPSVFS